MLKNSEYSKVTDTSLWSVIISSKRPLDMDSFWYMSWIPSYVGNGCLVGFIVGFNVLDWLNGFDELNGFDGLNVFVGLNPLDGLNGLDGLNEFVGLNPLDGVNEDDGVNGDVGLNGDDWQMVMIG